MGITLQSGIPYRGEFRQTTVYAPAKHPGFAAWATAFEYGDGTFGLSFDEVIEEEDPDFTPARLEFAEACGIPVSYGTVECGSASARSWRVYMRSDDGEHFKETGRCPRKEGSFCNVGFPNGRILGFDVPRYNREGTGWGDFIRVRESNDGGSTWTRERLLLKGSAPYLWRVRRLRGGTIVVLASMYGTCWGQGLERGTRNTMLPGEAPLNKIQPFFLTSEDGKSFSAPNYILPGIGAHEYDFAQLPDGRLLFIAGDVQGTPVGRQFVSPSPDGWVNGALFPIREGAPKDPANDPQGGFVPETLAWDGEHGCIVGYRRNKCFSVSKDFGENWTPILTDPSYEKLYQPFLLPLGGGRFGLYGHVGGDNAFGEMDMTIQAQVFCTKCAASLPDAAKLSLKRLQNSEATQYENRFRACLCREGKPLEGRKLEFRFNTYWNEDGSVNTALQEDAPLRLYAVTDKDGCGEVHAAMYDRIADIHLAYNVDVVYRGAADILPCLGPAMTVLALTPKRGELFPYDAYFAGGVLYLSPGFQKDFPKAYRKLREALDAKGAPGPDILCPEAIRRLIKCGAVKENEDGSFCWIKSVHAKRTLADVKPMISGDLYI